MGEEGSGRTAYGGASGGHVNQRVVIPSSFSSVGITIGGGGGGGGGEDHLGKGLGGAGWGGGGGGSETVGEPLHIAQGVSPGGNGASCYINCQKNLYQLATSAAGSNSKNIASAGVTLQAGLGYSKIRYSCCEYSSGNGSLEGGGGGGGGSTGVAGGGGGGATFFWKVCIF